MATSKPRKIKRGTTADLSHVEQLAKEYIDLRSERDDAAASMTAVRDQIVSLLEGAGENSLRTERHQVVLSRPTSMTLDEEGLKDDLDPELWSRITTTILDRNKLDAYIKSGEVDPDLVAQHTVETPRSPVLRVTVRK